MSRKSQVKASIDAKIKQNGKQEITGPILNGILNSMLDASVIDIVHNGQIIQKDEDGNVNLSNLADKAFVGNEVQEVYNALAGSITTEKNRAEAAEGLIKSIADSKLTRVDLACDGYEPLKITYRGDTRALTFQEIYDLVTDKSKFVTLLDSEMFILLPSLSIDGDAIEFAGINVMSHQAEAQRVIINQENQVSVYPIELENSDRKVSSAEGISGADAFIKYPNIKALKDYVAAHGGGLTPEQEQKLNESINQATAGQVAHEAIDGELTEYGSISTAIKNHHDSTKQNTLTPGTNITIENNVISSQGISDAPSDGKTYGRNNGAWAEVQGGGEDWELIRSESFADYGGGAHNIILGKVADYKEIMWTIEKSAADTSLSGWIRPQIRVNESAVSGFTMGWTHTYTNGLRNVRYSGRILYNKLFLSYRFSTYTNLNAQGSANASTFEFNECYPPSADDKTIMDAVDAVYMIPLLAGSYNGTETIHIYGKRR